MEFLNDYEGALMVIITSIYVFATILICVFNGRSAKSTREQVLESQRQFKETQRLEYRPYFDVLLKEDESLDFGTSDILLFVGKEHPSTCTILSETIMLKNIGAGTATNLMYHWQNNNGDTQEGDLPFKTHENGDVRIVKLHFQVEFLQKFETYSAQNSLVLKFQDLLENQYEQNIIFTLNVSDATKTKLSKIEAHTPVLID